DERPLDSRRYTFRTYIHSSTSAASVPSLFFFTDTAPPDIYTLSLHDALPISPEPLPGLQAGPYEFSLTRVSLPPGMPGGSETRRSEEHTSELQSLAYLVCRLLLEKKKNNPTACPDPERSPLRDRPATSDTSAP